ncbi:hypothetical protein [Leptolyngbya sp. 7M]|uniref:hypothetical protein n=1 Tax=Leptolyngbya sp. 7M TaxID=2812896 RepID=UPI001B8B58CD|nr:hypothetical protein [Leptolyngbya sp. 7M]QYO64672.1 hypothetical protein JVX88_34500 [Leptolyngbya sp. 7M]
MTRELLRQVRLLDPLTHTDRVADVLIEASGIVAIESAIHQLSTDTKIQDCTGLILGHGLVDLYSHSGEPGFEDRETLDSLLQAATAGGFTRLNLLPDTQPAIDNPAAVEWVGAQLSNKVTQVRCWGALTLGAKGDQMVELGELAATDIVGFTDGQPLQNWALIRRILEYGQALGKPIALWCCDRALAGNGVVREGRESMRLGLPGVSTFSARSSGRSTYRFPRRCVY